MCRMFDLSVIAAVLWLHSGPLRLQPLDILTCLSTTTVSVLSGPAAQIQVALFFIHYSKTHSDVKTPGSIPVSDRPEAPP